MTTLIHLLRSHLVKSSHWIVTFPTVAPHLQRAASNLGVVKLKEIMTNKSTQDDLAPLQLAVKEQVNSISLNFRMFARFFLSYRVTLLES